MADEYCAEYSDISVFLYPVWKKYIGKTGFATILLSVWLYLIPVIDMSGDDYMLAALFGGAFTGIGMALVLRREQRPAEPIWLRRSSSHTCGTIRWFR